MGSHRVVLPDVKFSGQEDVREFLRDFGIFVAVNEWTDEKAGLSSFVCYKSVLPKNTTPGKDPGQRSNPDHSIRSPTR